jgi:hypothetical protein
MSTRLLPVASDFSSAALITGSEDSLSLGHAGRPFDPAIVYSYCILFVILSDIIFLFQDSETRIKMKGPLAMTEKAPPNSSVGFPQWKEDACSRKESRVQKLYFEAK